MKTVLLILFLTTSAVHLGFCLANKPLPRSITKVLLMPVLLAFYCAAADTLDGIVTAAILCGWAGDVLLLWPEKKPCFLGGLAAFLAGHVLYAVALADSIGQWFSPALLISVGVILAMVGCLAYTTLHKHLGEMRVPVIAYLVVILAMGFFALARFLAPIGSYPAFWAWIPGLACFGAGCFVLSDYLLARSLFIRRFAQCDFFIMLTYLAAQFCLVFAFASGL